MSKNIADFILPLITIGSILLTPKNLVNQNQQQNIIIHPIPEKIIKSQLAISFQEIIKIPNSGKNKPARLNFLTHARDRSNRLFVNDMRGKLYVIFNQKAMVYLDIQDWVGNKFTRKGVQRGLAYFAFHPNFNKNGKFYTVHSEKKDNKNPDFLVNKTIFNKNKAEIESSHHDVILEWQAETPEKNKFSGTFRELMRIEEPYEDHNVGQIGFNPNVKPGEDDYGLLYIAVADGGSDGFPVSQTDPLDNGQDLSSPLGKILRIDPFGTNSKNGQYGIPNDNPWAMDNDANTLGEIWAYGLRNPHRFSWDTQGSKKMIIAEIGQAMIEEINLGKKGANYGWGEREGTWVIKEENENILFKLPKDDAKYGYTYPVAQYDHDIPENWSGPYAIAIAGGYVYRGKAIPELVGHYIFADFGHDGRFFHVPVAELEEGKQASIKELRLIEGDREVSFIDLVGKSRSDVRFGVDEDGELYVTSKQDGIVRKIIPSSQLK